jgi:glyoxylase-like metal-dependent hydrolase (beta-lactamase superfamily II)
VTTEPTKQEEILPGVFRLEEIDGTRLLCQFILKSEDYLTIIDAGLPTSPWTTIVPAVEEFGGADASMNLLITHPDADHCGGTAALKAAYPHLVVSAHADDHPPIGDPDRTVEERYLPFADSDRLSLDPAPLARIVGRLGGAFQVDEVLTGEKWLPHGGIRSAVIHIPGHSAGHIGAWLPESRTLIAGDAIMGSGIRNRDGSLLYPPQFIAPSVYKRTIARIQGLQVETLLCAHEPPITGVAVKQFLDDSLEAAELLEAGVRSALGHGAETLDEICLSVQGSYGGLPAERSRDFAASVAGILTEMHSTGGLIIDAGSSPRRFRLANTTDW